MSFSTAVQQITLDVLQAHAPLTQPIYDNVPQDSPFPYVTIGEDIINQEDTDSELSVFASITVHTWSRARGKKELKQIQGVIYDALHRATPTLAGYKVVTIDFESANSLLDSDGKTRHGVQTFRMLLEQL